MLSYLAEQPGLRGRVDLARDLSSAYKLLNECFDAVCREEIGRLSLNSSDEEKLKQHWARTAFELHVARRGGREIRDETLAATLGVDVDGGLFRAVLSALDVSLGLVEGFTHEVFLEFWLARYLAERLSDERTLPEQIADMFSYQRSVVTNHLLRQIIRDRKHKARVVWTLRNAYFEAVSLQKRKDFARNQIVYLLGRIDDSLGTQSFLREVWQNIINPQVIRHSAAFAAIMLGDLTIEEEYYRLLRGSAIEDSVNRGYHLYYYEDTDVSEEDMPPKDDGASGANQALRHLFRRLTRTDGTARYLRRIELFTIRRFLENGHTLPIDKASAVEVLTGVSHELRGELPVGFERGVAEEVDKILRILNGRFTQRMRAFGRRIFALASAAFSQAS